VDFTDPDFWKTPAALIGSWQAILVGVIAIATALGSVIRWGMKPFGWAWTKIAWPPQKPIATTSRPLRFVQTEQQSFWGPATRNRDPGTQVSGHWHVTNMSDLNVVLLRARLDGYEAQQSHVAAYGFRDRVYSHLTPIPAGVMGQVTATFMFFPSIKTDNEPLIVDVIFTDNYEEEHRVPSRFRFIHA
jgi:hypothetical protein